MKYLDKILNLLAIPVLVGGFYLIQKRQSMWGIPLIIIGVLMAMSATILLRKQNDIRKKKGTSEKGKKEKSKGKGKPKD